ncbi:MAG TPA: hypothetical protein PL089_14990 [Ignavibacteria bacterium]|nr:hypothetical protein [Ignavibacteria bacterium]
MKYKLILWLLSKLVPDKNEDDANLIRGMYHLNIYFRSRIEK